MIIHECAWCNREKHVGLCSVCCNSSLCACLYLSACVWKMQWLLQNIHSQQYRAPFGKVFFFSCFGVKMCFSLSLKYCSSGCQMYNATRVSHLLNMLNNDDITVRVLEEGFSVFGHERTQDFSGQKGWAMFSGLLKGKRMRTLLFWGVWLDLPG